MGNSKKKIALTVVFILIIVAAAYAFLPSMNSPTVNVYVDGENVSCSIIPFSPENQRIQEEICDYTLDSMYDQTYNVNGLKEGIENICIFNGLYRPHIIIDSNLGENSYPAIFQVEGNSMFPTLKNGQIVIVNKTKDLSVDDIVVANTSEYGVIVKRVSEIKDNRIHLVSDNKHIDYKEIDGIVYETKGIETWSDISTIFGIVKIY